MENVFIRVYVLPILIKLLLNTITVINEAFQGIGAFDKGTKGAGGCGGTGASHFRPSSC